MRTPILDLYLEIPLVQVWTGIYCHRDYAREFEYIKLHIKIHKWEFNFKLYEIARHEL
jgi:hypothetical protein